MRQIFQGGPVLPFSVLTVDRAQLLQSALAQIGALDGLALKKQLKVRFVGEEGVDEGEWRRTAVGVVAARWRRGSHVLLVIVLLVVPFKFLYATQQTKNIQAACARSSSSYSWRSFSTPATGCVPAGPIKSLSKNLYLV